VKEEEEQEEEVVNSDRFLALREPKYTENFDFFKRCEGKIVEKRPCNVFQNL